MDKQDLYEEIRRRVQEIVWKQSEDGSWRYCFEGSILTDVYFILLCELLGKREIEIVSKIVTKLIQKQENNGSWKMHADQSNGDLSVTIQAYLAIRSARQTPYDSDELKRAEAYILKEGGLKNSDLMTKTMLCIHNLYPYPFYSYIPPTIFLLKPSMLFSIYEFSNYARVHLTPLIILMNKRKTFPLESIPQLTNLFGTQFERSSDERYNTPFLLKDILQALTDYAPIFYQDGYKEAEKFMLERIEENGTLYSYASSTYYMVYALLALGYDKKHPIIEKAFEGIKSLYNPSFNHIENSPSTIWDTAYLSYVLQEVGVDYRHECIQRSRNYLLSRQHKLEGDWKYHAPLAFPGGWGFSDINTRVPDNDDTGVVLRALFRGKENDTYVEDAYNRGVDWLLSMQNDDGGWAAFEKNTNNEFFTKIPLQYAKDALIDSSSADITGRILEFLGSYEQFDAHHPTINRGIQWAIKHQEENGSWYGKWGVCYIYGTWAMITGLKGVGYTGEEVKKSCEWLLSIQREDGGWGESCDSSVKKKYIPLSFSTPVQTAWATHALIVAGYGKDIRVYKGILYLLRHHSRKEKQYPVGMGLPSSFYILYHSYVEIFPLLVLAEYVKFL